MEFDYLGTLCEMQHIDFFSLSRPIQERFIDAARAQGAPAPILVARPPAPLPVLGWGAAAAALCIGWIWFLRIGYGDLKSSFALAPIWTIGVAAALITAALLCGLRARNAWNKRRSLPFLPTVYLFPIGVIDARGARFIVHSLNDLKQVEPAGGGVRLRFGDGAAFTFPVPAARRTEAIGLVQDHREKLASLPEDARDKELVLLDPLRDNGFRNPFSPVDSLRPPSNKGWYKEPLLALAVGLLLGASAYRARNVLSEAKLYADARALDSTSAYRDYLARGGNRPDVADVLLPRAELRDAAKQGSVEAIEGFIGSHPDSKIGAEVQTALKSALLSNLEGAQQAGTLAALADFQTRYGRHKLVDQEVMDARKKHMARVLADFQNKSNGDPEVIDFVRRLINWSAKKGPRVVVRFRRRLPTTIEDIEKQIWKSRYFAGESTLPSKFFDATHSAQREEQFGREIIERLQQVLPVELVKFELEPTIEEAGEDMPQVEVPTLLFTYRHEVSGTYISRNPRGVFAGVGIFVKTHFVLPGDNEAMFFKYNGWHAPDVRRLEAGELQVPNVYDDMTEKAFHKFMKKYFATWFKD